MTRPSRPRWSGGDRSARCAVLLVLMGLAWDATGSTVRAQDTDDDHRAVAESLGWPEGAHDAPVTVVEFTDISCPYCASFHQGTRRELIEEFVSSGRVRWIRLSYVSGLYPNSERMSVAAECAGRQGRYGDFLEAAYGSRDSWTLGGNVAVADAIDRLAVQVDVDRESFEACLVDPTVIERIQSVGRLARDVGVRGTPTWVVDGFPVMGDLPLAYARSFILSRLSPSS